MKRISIFFLQGILVLVGLGILTFLLWEPHLEGRNVNATWFEIYFKDPFLVYVYLGSIPFFVAIYQGCKVLGNIRRNQTFSPATVKALKTIKLCSLGTAALIIGAEVFILIASRRHNDDAAGAVMLGLIATIAFLVVGTAAAVFARVLQNAVDLKSENDLTV